MDWSGGDGSGAGDDENNGGNVVLWVFPSERLCQRKKN